jgi:membrane fusion protein (multidrug efflux system)
VALTAAEVRPQIDGLIEKRLFTEGGNVEIGQQLYQIEDDRYRATYERALANLKNATSTRDRLADLLKRKSVSKQDFDDAEANWELARAEAELARIDVEFTQVKAPVSGRIGRSTITNGTLVTAGQTQPLAIVQQLDPIHIDISQPVTELLRLRKDLAGGKIQRNEQGAANIQLILEDGQIYSHVGTLEFSEVSVDQNTGSVTLRATVPNPDWQLLPGMFVHARLNVGYDDDVILAPQQAVQRDATGTPAIWVVDDDTANLRPISTSRTLGNMWLVDDGLSAGDLVVTEGQLLLRPGAKVTTTPASNVHPIINFQSDNGK